jgi:hypothetical protein
VKKYGFRLEKLLLFQDSEVRRFLEFESKKSKRKLVSYIAGKLSLG